MSTENRSHLVGHQMNETNKRLLSLDILRGLDNEKARKFEAALDAARADGVITEEESDELKKMLRNMAK